jgi:GNAT superfamily N-acetyltransferase
MEIVRAKATDAEALTEIAVAAKRHWGYPEKWIESWSDLLRIRPEFIAAHETYIATIDARWVGFYALCAAKESIRLEHMWILPEFLRLGIGGALFVHAVARARALGFDRLMIESDPNAEGFYQRMGARRVSLSTVQLDGIPRQLPVLLYEIRDGAVVGAEHRENGGLQNSANF